MKNLTKQLASSACTVLVLSSVLATDSRSAAISTATARTEFDAIEVMSLQMGAGTNKAVQDHFYDGNAKSGLTGGTVVAAAPGAAAVPAAKYTGPAANYKSVTKGVVPPIVDSAAKAKQGVVKEAELQPAVKKTARPVTPTETETAKTVFNNKIDFSKVKIITGADMTLWGKILTMGGKAVVWGNKIYFPNDSNGQSKYDFGKNPAWYMHEVTHVYQYQTNGWSYVPKSLWAQLTKGQGAYDYQLVPGKAFGDYGIEQQAEIVRDYYYSSTGRSSATAAERAIMEDALKGEGLLK